MDTIAFNHIPVLFDKTINALNIKSDGIYIDCTAGGGGHSAAIAARLTTGRLIAIDRDPQAIEVLTGRFGKSENISIVHDNFFNIKSITESLGIGLADGILADLGVSSHQLDDASRGFSYRKDAPLDMRMSLEGTSAADVVNGLGENELSKILFDYGEEKFARRIAGAITEARKNGPITTTLQLADIVSGAYPAAARRDGHPARKTFQALRIYVNSELSGLTEAVNDMFDCLKPGGRLCIISFHSLEDRAVKQALTPLTKGCTCPKSFPVCVCGNKPKAKLFKPVTPDEDELSRNPRSRSAKLRTAEKLICNN